MVERPSAPTLKNGPYKKKQKLSSVKLYIVMAIISLLLIGLATAKMTLITSSSLDLEPDYIVTKHGKRVVLPSDLRLEKLQCPGVDDAQEMVYWQDIPQDSNFQSPFYNAATPKFLTFEPDAGGWNNIRMAMETVIALAHAMGRTLVLPPQQQMYLLNKDGTKNKQQKTFTFRDFFPIEKISNEHAGIKIITMQEFLTSQAITGKLIDSQTKQISYPPNNRTNWDDDLHAIQDELWPWLRTVSFMPEWDPEHCMAAFPQDPYNAQSMQDVWDRIIAEGGFPSHADYVDKPVRVYASASDRLKENNRDRESLCIYDNDIHQNSLIHFHGKRKLGGRLLVHFYAFLFFQDWRHDLWTKRFVRDHVRYINEIQCAAAKVVQALRKRARARDPTNPDGEFDAFHVRRGEFQYKKTQISAKEMYDISQEEIPIGSTVYVATDERDKSFFKDLAEQYDVVYLDNFVDLLGDDINTNYYGMIDQLVASRSRTFFGCWFSTFTGYINRIRGYHADRLRAPGFARGAIDSYFYAPAEHKNKMREYWPVSGAFYAREFPVSWRNIDQGITALAQQHQQD